MKLHVFQSGDGDCLFLEGAAGGTMLCDGSRKNTMQEFVRGALHTFNKPIDVAYISHVDNDHISGVLQLLEDEVAWRVFDRHTARRTPRTTQPTFPRPPAIGGIFHNSFRDQIDDQDTSDGLEASLAITSSSLFATNVPELTNRAFELQNIATGIPEAIKVSTLAPPLNIPVNKLPGQSAKKLLMANGNPADVKFTLGSMKFTIVGPGKKELRDLKKGWKNWLDANQPQVAALRQQLQDRINQFSTGVLTSSPFDLGQWNGIDPVKGVTTPNVASLVLMVEENGHRLLLTGDAQPDVLLGGLTDAGFVQNGALHLDVLKVQHHGSSHNVTKEFARTVSADNYVFCGNGRNGNPDLPVLDIIFNSRLGSNQNNLARSPIAAGRNFKYWFSTSSGQITGENDLATFLAIEAKVNSQVANSGGQLTAAFNGRPFNSAKPFVTVDIP